MSAQPRPVRWALLVCLGAGLGALGMWAFAESPPSPTDEPHTVVLRGSTSVVTAIRDLARLESASYHVERVIDLRDRQTRLFGLVQGEDALLLVAAADISAGVDLTAMRTGDITFDPVTRQAQIVLPPASVFSARLDNERTYVHSRTTDLLAERAETLETRARQEAERSLKEAALEAGLLTRAQENATRTIRTLVHSLGYDEVVITVRGE